MDPALAYPAEGVTEVAHRPLTLESVYREHFKPVWRLLRRLGVSLSQLDDATQDVFLVVHRKLDSVAADGPLRSWIYAIAVRVASEYRRRAGRARAEQLDIGIADASPGPGQLSEMQESIRLLHELLAELDDAKRTVFVLSELEQLSVPEIASLLGVNLNTVYSRRRKAKQLFEAALQRRRAARRGGSP